MKRTAKLLAYGAFAVAVSLLGAITVRADDQTILNVSYDPTRELYVSMTRSSPSTGPISTRVRRSRCSSRMAARAPRPRR